MRSKGTPEQLNARRERALKLLEHGQKPSEVAAAVGVTDGTIGRWRDTAHKPKPRASRPPGRPSVTTAYCGHCFVKTQEFCRRGRYCSASARWAVWIDGESAKSEMVRDSLSTR